MRPIQTLLAVAIAGVALAMSSHAAAQRVSDAEMQYREALRKQQVQGDLAGAIRIYRDIVAKTTDGALKAKALLGLGLSLDTQGQQSQSIYQQIVRDFPNSPEAREARAKIAARQPVVSPTMAVRRIEMPEGLATVGTTDGQRVVDFDRPTGTVMIRDIDGKNKRTVFQSDRLEGFRVSRDLSTVFLFFSQAQEEKQRFAFIKTDGTGYREYFPTIDGQPMNGFRPECLSWAWDTRSVLMCKPDFRGSRLFRISAQDGSVTHAVGDADAFIEDADYSPDGRFIAYRDAVPAEVRVVAAQGGSSQLVARDAWLADWSRDGKHLLIVEEREGRMALAAVPMQNGRPSGERIAIPSSLSFTGFPSTMPNGALQVRVGGRAVYNVAVASLDAADRMTEWKPVPVFDARNFAGYPSWSPDGTEFAYVARRDTNLTGEVRIRNVMTGADHGVYRSEGRVYSCLWARQRPNLFCSENKGADTEIWSVSLTTKKAEKVGLLKGERALNRLSEDDRTLFTSGIAAGYEWEIGTEKEITHPFLAAQLAPDGSWVFAGDSNPKQLLVQPRAGFDSANWKPLTKLRTQLTPSFGPIAALPSPDSKWIVYHDKDPDGEDGLYRISPQGGEPQRLGSYPTDLPNSYLTISPDGRRFLSVTITPPQKQEFWALENFLPAARPQAR